MCSPFAAEFVAMKWFCLPFFVGDTAMRRGDQSQSRTSQERSGAFKNGNSRPTAKIKWPYQPQFLWENQVCKRFSCCEWFFSPFDPSGTETLLCWKGPLEASAATRGMAQLPVMVEQTIDEGLVQRRDHDRYNDFCLLVMFWPCMRRCAGQNNIWRSASLEQQKAGIPREEHQEFEWMIFRALSAQIAAEDAAR